MITEICMTQDAENLNTVVNDCIDRVQTSQKYVDKLVTNILNSELHDDNVVVEVLTPQEQVNRMVSELEGVSAVAVEVSIGGR